VLRYQVWVDESPGETTIGEFPLQNVADARPIHIIGMGPAGLFAALNLIRLGFKPVIVERGKGVRERRRDLAVLNKQGIVNPESNYCFGEGGAGTFSDGKLYTRSTKRGDTRRVLETLVQFGATDEILIDTHPHIGTNKLPKIIQAMRAAILAAGGEVHFNHRLSGLRQEGGVLKAIQVNDQEWWPVEAVLLATGHSARDIFQLLHRENILVEAKPFALGVRVEHPQSLIDRIQYHHSPRHPNLPAASYSLVQQVRGKGVYSFCMCPGGIICPAATQQEEIVVNGWSPSKRNSPFSNSGMVVEVAEREFAGSDALAAMRFQAQVEQKAWELGGGKQTAPASRLLDFVRGKTSQNLPDCSYLPGTATGGHAGRFARFCAETVAGSFSAIWQTYAGLPHQRSHRSRG
jgi:uncharacterized FAD-dependent dehydrogenase